MQIKWLEDAVNDLQSLREYIAQDNPATANRIAKKIIDSVSHLELHPAIGKAGRVLHTREWVVSSTPFIIVYRVHQNVVEILRVLHSSIQWPGAL